MLDNSRLIANALEKTNPTFVGSLATLTSYVNELTEQGAKVSLYRSYERGEHRASITDQMKAMLRLPTDDAGINDLNDNYCKIVVDKMSGRLYVSEVNLPDNDSEDAKAWLDDLLTRNDFEALQGMIFRGAIRDGDNFVLIDPTTLTWLVEPAYDGFSGIVAIFDGVEKTPTWACKIWSEAVLGSGLEAEDLISSPMRLIVYQPDRISYWVGMSGSAEVYPDNRITQPPSEDKRTPSEMTNVVPWSLGVVPIVHFVNQYDTVSFLGESELRPAIPLQDVLNRTVYSMVMASEFSAFRIKWSIGMEIDADGITPGAIVNLTLKDGNGNVVTEISEGMAEFLKAVRVGEFEATDMSQYIQQIVTVVKEISQTTQTPIYGITVEGALSGEALKQLEVGLIGKVERFQRENADSIKELIELTAEMQNIFDTEVEGEAPEFEKVSLTWKPAELLDITSRIAALIKMRTDAPGLWPDSWYRQKVGGLLGMSQSEIVEAESEAQTQQQTNLETLVGSAGGATIF